MYSVKRAFDARLAMPTIRVKTDAFLVWLLLPLWRASPVLSSDPYPGCDSGVCSTAVPGDDCYNAIIWLQTQFVTKKTEDASRSIAEKYPGVRVTAQSSFKEIQSELHQQGLFHCKEPWAPVCSPPRVYTRNQLNALRHMNCGKVKYAQFNFKNRRLQSYVGLAVVDKYDARAKVASQVCEQADAALKRGDVEAAAVLAIDAWGQHVTGGMACCSIDEAPYCSRTDWLIGGFGWIKVRPVGFFIMLYLLGAVVVARYVFVQSSKAEEQQRVMKTLPENKYKKPSSSFWKQEAGDLEVRLSSAWESSCFSRMTKPSSGTITGKESTDITEVTELRDRIQKYFLLLQAKFDFQPDSVVNQYEHFLSMVRSHRCIYEDAHNYNVSDEITERTKLMKSIEQLHGDLLEGFGRWRQKFVAADKIDHGFVTNFRAQYDRDEWKVVEVAALLLVWGELGNLRFMPELMYFILHLVLANMLDGDSSPCVYEACGGVSHKFLSQIVRPIYNEVFDETYDYSSNANRRQQRAGLAKGGVAKLNALKDGLDKFLPPHVANYDDWNELFFDPDRLLEQLNRGTTHGTWTKLNASMLKEMPNMKWKDVLHRDQSKTHKELHKMLGLLASTHRIWFLHVALFLIGICWIAGNPSTDLSIPLAGRSPAIRFAFIGLLVPIYGVSWFAARLGTLNGEFFRRRIRDHRVMCMLAFTAAFVIVLPLLTYYTVNRNDTPAYLFGEPGDSMCPRGGAAMDSEWVCHAAAMDLGYDFVKHAGGSGCWADVSSVYYNADSGKVNLSQLRPLCAGMGPAHVSVFGHGILFIHFAVIIFGFCLLLLGSQHLLEPIDDVWGDAGGAGFPRPTWRIFFVRWSFWILVFATKFLLGASVLFPRAFDTTVELKYLMPGRLTWEELQFAWYSTGFANGIMQWFFIWFQTLFLFCADTAMWYVVFCPFYGLVTMWLLAFQEDDLWNTFKHALRMGFLGAIVSFLGFAFFFHFNATFVAILGMAAVFGVFVTLLFFNEDRLAMIRKRYQNKVFKHADTEGAGTKGFMEAWSKVVEYMEEEHKCSAQDVGLMVNMLNRKPLHVFELLLKDNFQFQAKTLPRNPDVQWRLAALSRGLQLPIPEPFRAPYIPGITVLVPHYGESILLTKQDLWKETQPGKGDLVPLIDWLHTRYRDEFGNLMGQHDWPVNGTNWQKYTDDEWVDISKWASMHMQTVWRTIAGMCYYYPALQVHMKLLPEGDRNACKHKMMTIKDDGSWDAADCFTCLLAMQNFGRHKRYKNEQDAKKRKPLKLMLQHADDLLKPHVKDGYGDQGLKIAYPDWDDNQEKYKGDNMHPDQACRYFSCLVDARCPYEEEPTDSVVGLRVVIESAEDLPNGDILTESDPYCKVEISYDGHFKGGEDDQSRQTNVVKNSNNPTWKDRALFLIDTRKSLSSAKIRFQVFDKDPLFEDDLLGEATTTLTSMTDGSVGSWTPSTTVKQHCLDLTGGEVDHQSKQSTIRLTTQVISWPGSGGARIPRFAIELPGHPILGDGKSDNQNVAIIFARGTFQQCIDANQGGYFEQMLMLPCVLGEFRSSRPGEDGRDKRKQIIGLPEHITSDFGSMGDFAAGSEAAFGTILQRTYALLGSRMHYGHPDIMNKEYMIQQGGVSKATRTLNLSEDIFAGMDFTLRGDDRRIRHCEYMHVSKGRDLGFNSVLGFFSKLSSGAGEQILSRQMFRLHQNFGLPEALAFWYSHVGHYLTQALLSWALPLIVFCWLLIIVSDSETVLAAFMKVEVQKSAAQVMAMTISGEFQLIMFIFLVATSFPLVVQMWWEVGLLPTLTKYGKQLLTLSPLMFVFQAKVIGHYFAVELREGGAKYVATGRSLPTDRRPFIHVDVERDAGGAIKAWKSDGIYLDYCNIASYDGLQLLFLCILVWLSGGASFEGLRVLWFCIGLTVISWMFAPYLYNPYMFHYGRFHDVDWAGWLNFFINSNDLTAVPGQLDIKGAWVVWYRGNLLPKEKFPWYKFCCSFYELSFICRFFAMLAFFATLEDKLDLLMRVYEIPHPVQVLWWAYLIMPPVLLSGVFCYYMVYRSEIKLKLWETALLLSILQMFEILVPSWWLYGRLFHHAFVAGIVVKMLVLETTLHFVESLILWAEQEKEVTLRDTALADIGIRFSEHRPGMVESVIKGKAMDDHNKKRENREQRVQEGDMFIEVEVTDTDYNTVKKKFADVQNEFSSGRQEYKQLEFKFKRGAAGSRRVQVFRLWLYANRIARDIVASSISLALVWVCMQINRLNTSAFCCPSLDLHMMLVYRDTHLQEPSRVRRQPSQLDEVNLCNFLWQLVEGTGECIAFCFEGCVGRVRDCCRGVHGAEARERQKMGEDDAHRLAPHGQESGPSGRSSREPLQEPLLAAV